MFSGWLWLCMYVVQIVMVVGIIGWWCYVCGRDSSSCMVVYDVVGDRVVGMWWCGGVHVLWLTVVVVYECSCGSNGVGMVMFVHVVMVVEWWW